MPYPKGKFPNRIKMLPTRAQEVWVSAFNSFFEEHGEESSNAIAWAAVKKAGYDKDKDGHWKKIHEAKKVQFKSLGRTLSSEQRGKVWRVVIVSPGLSENNFDYPETVLREAVPLFNGRPAILRADDEHLLNQNLSVGNIVGYYSDCCYEDEYGVVGTLTILDTHKELMQSMAELWDEGLLNPNNGNPIFAYSMVAGGLAFADDTNYNIMVAREIREVCSVDLVVMPASKTKTLAMIQGKKKQKPQTQELCMDRKKMMKYIEARAPQLVTKIKLKEGEEGADAELEVVFTEAINLALEPPAKKDPPKKDPPKKTSAKLEPDGITPEEIREFREANSTLILEGHLRGAVKLHDVVKDKVRQRLKGQIYKEAQVLKIISEETTAMDALVAAGFIKPSVLGTPRTDVGMNEARKQILALDGFFAGEDLEKDKEKVPRYRSFREAYVGITGDGALTGRTSEAPGLKKFREALDSGSWAEILGDSITRRMVAEYGLMGLNDWRLICSDITPIKDFRTNRRMRMGYYANLPGVAQGGTYQPLTSPTDEEATYAVSKKGGTEELTIEMIANDDVGAVRRIPLRLARAAKQTLYEFVFSFISDNGAIYDSVALGHADHSNLGSTALSHAAFITARQSMQKQTGYGSTKRLGLVPKFILHPIDLEELAVQLVVNKVVTTDTFSTKVSVINRKQQGAVDQVTVKYWSDATDWALVCDPTECPTIEVGFLNGNEEPELFVQDSPVVGSMFSADKLTYKIRHIYGACVLDYRGFFLSVVAG